MSNLIEKPVNLSFAYQKILVTGGNGFAASHFIDHMLDFYKDVHLLVHRRNVPLQNLDRVSDSIRFKKAKEAKRIDFLEKDLQERFSEIEANNLKDIEVILHFAGSYDARASILDPNKSFYDNIVATFNLLELARTLPKLKKFVFISSAAVYGKTNQGSFLNEAARHRPITPFAATKGACDDLVRAWGNSYDLPVITVTTNNLFGERQDVNAFLPTMVRAIVNKVHIPLCTDNQGKPVLRQFLHARNFARGLVETLEKGRVAQTYNLVGELRDELEMIEAVHKILNEKPKIHLKKGMARDLGYGDKVLLDGKATMQKLDIPKWWHSLDLSLSNSLNWMLNNKNLRWLYEN